MTTRFRSALLALTIVAAVPALPAGASAQVMVGGAPMDASKGIADDAVNTKGHAVRVAPLKAGGLLDSLGGRGPFTVSAPVGDAFATLPPGTAGTRPAAGNTAALAKAPAIAPTGNGVTGSGSIVADMRQSASVIHVRDHVLIPA